MPPTMCVQDGLFRSDVWALSPWLQYGCLIRKFNLKSYKKVATEKEVRDLVNSPFQEFETFEIQVRQWLHNAIHNAVGGTMAQKESSSAPEFWFHHGFLDKIWFDWQKRGAAFKFHYFRSVRTPMPGADHHFGREYMDLANQPMCVRAVYDDTV